MNNIVGKNIKQRRLELHMTQETLAKRLGYKSKAAISSVEHGREDISTERVRKFAKALSCKPADLMGWEIDRHDAFQPLITAYLKAPENIQKSICMSLGIDYIKNDRP